LVGGAADAAPVAAAREVLVIGRRELAGGAAIVVLLAILGHGPALGGGFVYDDHWTIVENAYLRSPHHLARLLTAAPARAGVPDAGRPTLLATEIVDHLLWGESPRGYHLQSLAWHVGVSLLFFLALAALTGELLLALTAAALFTVHPLGVEAVAAINYREDLLAAFFTLAALAALGAARRSGRGRGRGRVAAFLFLVIGGFAKESAAIAPILLVLLDLGAPAEERRSRRLDLVVLVVAALLPVAWRAWAMGGPALVSHTAEIPPEHRTPLAALPIAAWSFASGVGQWLVPRGLSPDYVELEHQALGWAALGLIALAAVGAWRLRTRQPWIALGVLGAIAAYLPTFGLLPISNLRADRYFYLPSLALALATAALVSLLVSRVSWLRRRTFEVPRAWLLVTLLVAGLGARTRHQVRIWHDDLTLWTHATRVQPAASRAWTLLAEARLRRGLLPGARAAVEQSLIIADDPHARELLGIVLMEQGDLDDAHRELERALAGAEPHHRAEWLNNLGACELRMGRVDEALSRFQEARRLAPDYEAAWLNAARALQQKGDREGARRLLQERPGGAGP
jgi:tetratricopeptide (TPR) repeat protein